MQKLFYEDSWNSRRSKHVVRYCDGVSTHRDGSRFFDARLFSTYKAKDQFVRGLLHQGYADMRTAEVEQNASSLTVEG